MAVTPGKGLIMGYVFLVSSMLCGSTGSLVGTAYNRTAKDFQNPTSLYNLFNIGTALVLWLVLWLTDFSFDAGMLWYSLGFGVSYFMASFGLIGALANGPTALTALGMQLSSFTAAIWGFFFWGEQFTLLVGIGLVLIVVALVVCLYQRSDSKEKFSLKWFLFVLLAFAGNSGCMIVQRTAVRAAGVAPTKMMMFFAMILSVLTCVLLYIKKKCDKPMLLVKKAGYFPLIAGAANTLNNLIVILTSAENSPFSVGASFFYPVLAIGGLAITSFGSMLLFRERLTPRQWVGMAIGAVGVVLLAP